MLLLVCLALSYARFLCLINVLKSLCIHGGSDCLILTILCGIHSFVKSKIQLVTLSE